MAAAGADRPGPYRHEARVRIADPEGRSVWRSALAWQVMLFMGLQSLWTYVLIAWLPTIFTDHGMSRSTAGVVFAFNNGPACGAGPEGVAGWSS